MGDILTYSELVKFATFEERFNYLMLAGVVGEPTFGSRRYLNQVFYHSPEWRLARNKAIVRDNGLDLALDGYPIRGTVYVHHLNPITEQDILERSSCLTDLENLVCVSFDTHTAITYGSRDLLPKPFVERSENDTCLWR